MSEQPESAGRVPIRSAADFFTALRSPDMTVRLSILRAISHAPERALAFGSYQGRDVVDELVAQFSQTAGYLYWKALAGTLSAFRDPRVIPPFRKALMMRDNPEALRIVAARLSQEPPEVYRQDALNLLHQDNSPAHVSVAADLLSTTEDLATRDRVRITIMNTSGAKLAEVDVQNVPAWVDELNGRFGPEARQALDNQGDAAFAVLAPHFTALRGDSALWLLDWAVTEHPVDAVGMVAAALESEETSLVLAAIQAVEGMGALAPSFRSRLAPLVDHADRAVRLAAVVAGAPVPDVRSRFETATEPDEIAAYGHALASAEGEVATDALVPKLADERWQVRAAIVQILQELGPAVIEPVRPLVDDPRPEVRAAAIQVLMSHGEHGWLESRIA